MMRPFIFVFSLFALACASIYLSVKDLLPQHSQWNQRLSLIIDTPKGEVTASGVMHIDARFTSEDPVIGGAEVTYKVTGEAVPIKLGEQRYLFALLPSKALAFFTFGPGYQSWQDRGDILYQISQQTGKGPQEVARVHYPRLVMFDNVSDPTSLRPVDPENFAGAFGAGYSLRKITLEITEDPVTVGGVKTVLKAWLEMAKGSDAKDAGGIPALHLPDDSPQGYRLLSAQTFWTPNIIMELEQAYK